MNLMDVGSKTTMPSRGFLAAKGYQWMLYTDYNTEIRELLLVPTRIRAFWQEVIHTDSHSHTRALQHFLEVSADIQRASFLYRNIPICFNLSERLFWFNYALQIAWLFTHVRTSHSYTHLIRRLQIPCTRRILRSVCQRKCVFVCACVCSCKLLMQSCVEKAENCAVNITVCVVQQLQCTRVRHLNMLWNDVFMYCPFSSTHACAFNAGLFDFNMTFSTYLVPGLYIQKCVFPMLISEYLE